MPAKQAELSEEARVAVADVACTWTGCAGGLLLSPMLVSRPMDGLLQEAEIKRGLCLKEAVQTTAMGWFVTRPSTSQGWLGHRGVCASG